MSICTVVTNSILSIVIPSKIRYNLTICSLVLRWRICWEAQLRLCIIVSELFVVYVEGKASQYWPELVAP